MAKARMDRKEDGQFFQLVCFYAEPAAKTLGIENNKKLTNAVKERKFVMPFYSREIFYSEKDAIKWIPNFIKELIDLKRIPKDVFKQEKDGNYYIDKDICQTCLAPLVVTEIELDDSFEVVK